MTRTPSLASPLVPPLFVASHLALDFLNSHATPNGESIEWIGNGTAFATWYRAAGLAVTPSARARIARFKPEELDATAATARALRESIRAGLRIPQTARTNPQLRAVLNRWMAKGSSFLQLEDGGDEVELVACDRWTDAEQLLVPLATAAAQLLVAENLSRVRVCEGPTCSLWFLDRTKAGTRCFCSAATCGNRAKVAAFRARERGSLKGPRAKSR